ncbi:MAG: hypothetical protein IJO91_08340 [Oscillospiraceae bacterium]|nr:hypothetical protein [Oscillospiraceae bacterium]
MAGVLQGEVFPEINVGLLERVEQLVEAACDYSSQTVFFPVRHHSPACSLHLKRVIAEYRPDCILAEGPSDANGLIDVLIDSKAPVAIYCSFSDKKGEISEDKTDYKCYYPFLDCSPELVALREAAALGIKSEFIDLAYCDILKSQKEGRGLRRNDASYNDDYLITRSSYISKLCQQLGMRSFDELWEKYFEISAFEQETKQFMRSLLTYCLISRDDTSPEELAEEGCHARENCMARHIIEAKKEYNRILVVTGGFHTCVLPELAAQDDIKAEKKTKNTQQLYPIA